MAMLITDHIRAAAEVAKLDPAILTGRSRHPIAVRARWALMVALKERRHMSNSDIGRCLNRHHTTVMEAISNAQYLRGRDVAFDQLCKRIAAIIPIRERAE